MSLLPAPVLHSSPRSPKCVPDRLVLPQEPMASGGSCKPATHEKCTACQTPSTCVLCFALQATGGMALPSKCRNNRHEGKSIREEMVHDMEQLKEPAITSSTFSPHIIKALQATTSMFNSCQHEKLSQQTCTVFIHTIIKML